MTRDFGGPLPWGTAMHEPHTSPSAGRNTTGLLVGMLLAATVAAAIIPINYGVYVRGQGITGVFLLVAALQSLLGLAATLLAVVYYRRSKTNVGRKAVAVLVMFVGTSVAAGGPCGVLLAKLGDDFMKMLVSH